MDRPWLEVKRRCGLTGLSYVAYHYICIISRRVDGAVTRLAGSCSLVTLLGSISGASLDTIRFGAPSVPGSVSFGHIPVHLALLHSAIIPFVQSLFDTIADIL